MLAGFVKYLMSARMDCTVPRFTVTRSWCAVPCDLLRFGCLSFESVKRKDAPRVRASNVILKIDRNEKAMCHVQYAAHGSPML